MVIMPVLVLPIVMVPLPAASIVRAMSPAAAEAIAGCVGDDELDPQFVVPSVFDKTVAPAVAASVADAATLEGVLRSRTKKSPAVA